MKNSLQISLITKLSSSGKQSEKKVRRILIIRRDTFIESLYGNPSLLRCFLKVAQEKLDWKLLEMYAHNDSTDVDISANPAFKVRRHLAS